MGRIWISWWPRLPSLRLVRRSLMPVTANTRWRDRAPPPGPSPPSSPASPRAPSGAPPPPPAPPRPGAQCRPPAPPPFSPPPPSTRPPSQTVCPSLLWPGPHVRWASTLAPPVSPQLTPPLISSSSSMSGISPSNWDNSGHDNDGKLCFYKISYLLDLYKLCPGLELWNSEKHSQNWEQNWNIYKLPFCQRNLYLPMDLKQKYVFGSMDLNCNNTF